MTSLALSHSALLLLGSHSSDLPSSAYVTGAAAFDRSSRTSTRGEVVIFANFDPPRINPAPGTISIDDYLAQFESDAELSSKLANARKEFADTHLKDRQSVSALRLKAGLSQQALAERINSSQSYVAGIEAGRTDPGTDSISKIAFALGLDPIEVFRAVTAKRAAIAE